ncbi:hypothetical protein R1sor_021388 [Riccia sorocarpa]|uniref:Snf1-related kinase interacting protein n=1 Tax=Riccia sorocarpa TaxID=122646 RepID=A0ABD3GIS4_9MARC
MRNSTRSREFDASGGAMDLSASLQSRIRSFSTTRKRTNVEMEETYTEEETLVVTPPNRNRTPARLRLSVSRKAREAKVFPDDGEGYDDGYVQDPQDSDVRLSEEYPMSDRRRALFEPLGPAMRGPRDGSPDSLLPPPDFEHASYPRGWVVGKKRKLVNVDVVESMRRIAVHEMNRKDREIDGLNEQLEEDARTMEHLQLQVQTERQKRLQAERENNVLQGQVAMLMNMLNEMEEGDDMHG